MIAYWFDEFYMFLFSDFVVEFGFSELFLCSRVGWENYC